MKNTCPKCDTAYNVSAAVIGRKFTCKNCSTPVIVTEAGLDYQTAPPKMPAAAPVAGAAGAAFDFDADGGSEEPERKPARAAKAAKPVKGRPRDEDDEPKEDADELDSLPARKPKKKVGGDKSLVKDFLFFREFIAPVFVKLIFVLALIGIVLSGLFALIGGLVSGSIGVILAALAYLVIGVPVNILLARVYCEIVLLGFAMYDSMGEIKALLEKANPPAPPAPPAP